MVNGTVRANKKTSVWFSFSDDVLYSRTSAANLKFLHHLPQARSGTSNR
jgi:hypothetical protein